jgi:hypothetical protein
MDFSNSPYRTWQLGVTQVRQTEVLDAAQFSVPGGRLLMDASFLDDNPMVPADFPAFFIPPDATSTRDWPVNYLVTDKQFSLYLKLRHSNVNAAEILQGVFTIYESVDPTAAATLLAG